MTKQNQNKTSPKNIKRTKIQGRDLCNKSGNIYEFQSIKQAIQNIYNNLHVHFKNIKKQIRKCLNNSKNSYEGFSWRYLTPNILHNEIWASIHPKLIKGLKYYEISTQGRIKYPSGKITCGYKNQKGYMDIKISNIHFQAHCLVARIFIHNDDTINKTVINHINEEKDDNKVENLEWCTLSQNSNYSKKQKNTKYIQK